MDKRVYWLWLQHAFSAGSPKPKNIYNRFSDLEEFHKGGVSLWSRMSFINEKECSLLASYTIEQAELSLEYYEKMGHKVLTPECDLYPELLWNIPDPPAVIYYRGAFPDFDTYLSVAIVGSRKTSDIVLSTTKGLAYELSRNGVIIVSGGAIGVDTAAHRGAMEGSSPTVAVLGCGLDYPYLNENELLRQKISDRGGAVITEYPPSMGVQKGTFQTRNRIISGLSKGIIVASANKKSGTMITARRALEQNRDIFAVPGNPMLPTSEGPNNLIKDGACPVTSAQDIIEYYGSTYHTDDFLRLAEPQQIKFASVFSGKQEDTKISRFNNDEFSEEAVFIYEILDKAPTHISSIADKTGLSPSKILMAVTELELVGVIEAYSGQRYSRK